MIDIEEFESVCRRLQQEYYGKNYRLGGRNADLSHKLKLRYSRIAGKYFYSEGISYPAEIIQRIAMEMDVFMTDFIRYSK